MISQKEKLSIMEKFFWRMNFHRAVTMNEAAVIKMLSLMDMWVNAHSDGNGERSERDQKININAAYEALKNLP